MLEDLLETQKRLIIQGYTSMEKEIKVLFEREGHAGPASHPNLPPLCGASQTIFVSDFLP